MLELQQPSWHHEETSCVVTQGRDLNEEGKKFGGTEIGFWGHYFRWPRPNYPLIFNFVKMMNSFFV